MGKKKQQDRREYRRRRRVRNQILAYLVLIFLLALIAFGGFQLIRLATAGLKQGPAEETQEVTGEEEAPVQEDPGTISTPEPVEEYTEPQAKEPEEPMTDPVILAYLEGMTIDQKIDGLFIVSPEALTDVDLATKTGEGTRAALGKYAVGGILYAPANVKDAEQFKEMVGSLKQMYRELYVRNVLTMVCEEGAVNTVAGRSTKVEAVASAAEIAETGNRENATEAFRNIGTYLEEYGIDVDLASIAGVRTEENSFYKDRCFSDDADIAASMTGAAVEGMQQTDTLLCLGAFPGEGGLTSDPDKGAGSTARSTEDLQNCEYKPFLQGIEAGAPMVMVSAMQAPEAGSELPCMLSETMISGELRDGLGFEGVVVTAPLGQIPSSAGIGPGEAAVMAVQAGADMIIVRKHDDFQTARTALQEAVEAGTISEERLDESLIRIYSMELEKM